MKFVLPVILILVSLNAQALTRSGAAQIRALEASRIPELQMPPMQVWDLPNGWHAILLEDHSLPLVSAQMLIRTSASFIRRDTAGVAGLLTRMLRSGGTLATPPDQLDDDLARMAIRISDGMSGESAKITMGTLSEYREPAFRHFFEMIFTPRFDPGRFDGAKKRRLDEIRRQNDTPGAIAQREFVIWLQGDSPWGWMPSRKTVSSLDLQDVRAFYQDHFVHGEKWLVVVGDITRHQLEAEVQKALKLDAPPFKVEPLPVSKIPDTPGVRIVQKKATQTAIVMGHKGTDRHNPDKYALMVMNNILGGAPFTNRLMMKIRTEKGLAYGTGSSFGFGPKAAPGLFVASAMTRASMTGEVVGLMKAIITDMHRGEGITAAEVADSKRSIMSSTLFELAEPFNAAVQRAQFDLYGLPPDYIQELRRQIMKVTVADVKRVAQKYLHPDHLRILVVGDPKTLKPQLAPFGKVEVTQPTQ